MSCFYVVDADIKCLTGSINAILNGFSRQITARWIPPMLEPHPSQSDYRYFFIGFSKTTVFHLESMDVLNSVSKKIIELIAEISYTNK